MSSNPTQPERPDPDELERLAGEIREQTEDFDDLASRLENAADRVREVYPDA